MIRVTFKSGQCITKENVFFVKSLNIIEMWYVGTERCDSVKASDIVKIEKQVKDLTLEEAMKLEIFCDLPYNEYFADVGNNMLELTDYIDITDLVKEQGK